MKKKIWVMIEIVLSKYDDAIRDLLIEKVRSKIKTMNNEIEVGIYSAEEYWKYPGEILCHIFLASEKEITVEEVIGCFALEWEYEEGMYHDAFDPLKRPRASESAVWSKHVMGGEFLDKFISWVHIYTWDTGKSLEEELEDEDV